MLVSDWVHKYFFPAQSETSIQKSRGTEVVLKVAPQGLSHSFLKTFAALIFAFYPDPTNRSWVSKDGLSVDLLL